MDAVARVAQQLRPLPNWIARQPRFSELPAVRADGARGDESGIPGLAPAHTYIIWA